MRPQQGRSLHEAILGAVALTLSDDDGCGSSSQWDQTIRELEEADYGMTAELCAALRAHIHPVHEDVNRFRVGYSADPVSVRLNRGLSRIHVASAVREIVNGLASQSLGRVTPFRVALVSPRRTFDSDVVNSVIEDAVGVEMELGGSLSECNPDPHFIIIDPIGPSRWPGWRSFYQPASDAVGSTCSGADAVVLLQRTWLGIPLPANDSLEKIPCVLWPGQGWRLEFLLYYHRIASLHEEPTPKPQQRGRR